MANVQITDKTSKATAAPGDKVLIRDITSNTDKQTTVSGLATAVAANLPAGSVAPTALSDAGWEELGRTTLGTAGNTITVSSIPARKYLRVMMALIATGGVVDGTYRFNGDSAANYAFTIDVWDGNTSSAVTAQTSLPTETSTIASGTIEQVNMDIVNFSTAVKLITQWTVNGVTTNATSSVTPTAIFAKWASNAQISSIVVTNGGGGQLAIGSEVIVLGHD